MKRQYLALIAATSMVTVAAPAIAATTTYQGTGFAIPDLSNQSSTISVASVGTVTGVTFTLTNLSHTFIGDLYGTLSHDGITSEFLARATGSSNDLDGTYTIMDGFAPLDGTAGSPSPSTTYGTFTPLSQFIGASTAGNWTLTINDEVGSDSGNLGSWSLTLSDSVRAVPEPATWAMMLVGFAAVGAAVRRRKVAGQLAAA